LLIQRTFFKVAHELLNKDINTRTAGIEEGHQQVKEAHKTWEGGQRVEGPPWLPSHNAPVKEPQPIQSWGLRESGHLCKALPSQQNTGPREGKTTQGREGC
jgi:hypothetical protein